MNDTEPDSDLFTEALRLDFPNERDEARVKRRLISAGVLAGASVVAPGAASAAASAGILSKLAALPLAVKIGASMVVMGFAAMPVAERVLGGESDLPVVRQPPPAVIRPADAPVTVAHASEPVVAPIAPVATGSESSAPVVEPVRSVLPAEPRRTRSAHAVVRPATEAAPQALEATTPASLPAVAELPAPAAPVDEGTLRAETALLTSALAAIQRGDLATARSELAAHATRFPNGHLKLERERALERTLGKETER